MGILNKGALGLVNNAGVIDPVAGGTAILSAGSIGTITNRLDRRQCRDRPSGERDRQWRNGKEFGAWGGGVITIGNGSLTFASGNTALADNIVVNGVGYGGTVFNSGALMVAAPQAITGNFAQSATGALDFGLAGDTTCESGSLAVSGLASVDGGLGLDLASGFTLAAGDSFDLMTYAGLSGGFTGVSVDGAACSSSGTDVWLCRKAGVDLDLSFASGALDLTVAGDAVAARARAIPEPSTWAMLALGFFGLGGLGLGKRKRADKIGLRLYQQAAEKVGAGFSQKKRAKENKT
jgi:hypothetical protein